MIRMREMMAYLNESLLGLIVEDLLPEHSGLLEVELVVHLRLEAHRLRTVKVVGDRLESVWALDEVELVIRGRVVGSRSTVRVEGEAVTGVVG
jgi:hypothetical protein